jgi:hypothetical protein
MSYPPEREHYRIQYPAAGRPHLVIEGCSFDVIDLSEQGVRFREDEGRSFSSGDKVAGTLRFRRTPAVEVTGSVVRVGGREVAVKLDVALPLRTIIEEQRFLREHHGGMSGDG